MKKNLKSCFIMMALIVSSAMANAQIQKGKILIDASGSLDFSSLTSKWENEYNSGDGSNTTTLKFTPGAGYFIANNFALGIQLSMNNMSDKEDREKYTETTTMLLPFALLYFGKGNVKPFIQAAFGPGWQKSGYNEKHSEKLSGYELGGGLAVFLNQHVSLDFSLGYASASAKYKDTSNVNWKTFTKGIGGNIGFSIIL